MTRLFLSCLLLVGVFVAPTTAQNLLTNRFFHGYAYEAITIDATVGGVGFTVAKLTDTVTFQTAQMAMVAVECVTSPCDIRYTYDGTTVTASVGVKLTEGTVQPIYGNENIRRFKAIRTAATSATIHVIYHY